MSFSRHQTQSRNKRLLAVDMSRAQHRKASVRSRDTERTSRNRMSSSTTRASVRFEWHAYRMRCYANVLKSLEDADFRQMGLSYRLIAQGVSFRAKTW
jgi:hypothetical protein